jgi:hypothetical protein
MHLDPHQRDKLDLEPDLDPNPFKEDRPKKKVWMEYEPI